MYILDKNNGGIDLYTITAKKEELKEYRKNIINAQKDKLFYYILSKDSRVLKDFTSLEEFDLNNISYNKKLASFINDLINYDGSSYNRMIHQYIDGANITNDYLNGLKDNNIPIKVISANEEFYYLVPKIGQIDYNNFILRQVMKLPKELYLLHLLLLGKYEKLASEPTLEQLKLFNIEYIKTITIEELAHLINPLDMPASAYDSIIKKAELDGQILQKRRK